jgi:hypothetical protein
MIRIAFAALGLLAILTPAAAAPAAVPQAMRGTWADPDTDACTNAASDGRTNVAAREVEFFASSCRLSNIRVDAGGRVTARAVCREEGDNGTDRRTLRLRLEAPDRLAIRSGTEEATMVQRCPRAMPVR